MERYLFFLDKRFLGVSSEKEKNLVIHFKQIINKYFDTFG